MSNVFVKQPFWKTWLSHLIELRIEHVDSVYSEKLEIIYKKGRYALCTPNAVYSYDDLYFNFRESFLKLPLDKLPIKSVLVLGVGLGSIPLMLETIFDKQYEYTLVEIDPKVIELAKKYNLDHLKSPLNIVCSDALEYVTQCTQQFDLIAVDLFIDDVVPSAFETIAFLEALKQLIPEKGLLLYNRLTYNEKFKEK
ncbi:MAG: hypothetical protein GY810_18010, partial [Aureispira sp.]|nr:hypothetical protein [Aureispira sp.]